jgi:hypothetical protein
MKKIIALSLLLGWTQMMLAQGFITFGGGGVSGNTNGIASGSSGSLFGFGYILTLGIDFSPLPDSPGTNQPSGSANCNQFPLVWWTAPSTNTTYVFNISITLGKNAATDGWVYEKEDDGSFIPVMELTNELVSSFPLSAIDTYFYSQSCPLTDDQLVSLGEGKWYAEVDYGNDKYFGNFTPSSMGPPTATLTVSPVSEFPTGLNIGTTLLENSFSEIVIAPNHNGLATMILDGSESTDLFNLPLQYSWMDGPNTMANTTATTNELRTGTHQISLTVDDGFNTATEVLNLDVISPEDAVNVLAPVVEQLNLKREKMRALTSKLEKAQNAFARGDTRSGEKFLTDFQKRIRIDLMQTDSATANWLIEGAQEIIDATHIELQRFSPPGYIRESGR